VRQSTLIAGKIGEDAAVSFLKRSDYTIVERNFRLRNGEIDIIVLDPSTGSGMNQTLVFVEVKTREGNRFGTPLEAITYFKLKYLIRTATVYSSMHPKLPKSLRIDAIAVWIGKDREILDIEHTKNISQ
jgi:putative endonuclease